MEPTSPIVIGSNRAAVFKGIINDFQPAGKRRVIFPILVDSLIPSSVEVTQTVLEINEDSKDEVLVQLTNLSVSQIKKILDEIDFFTTELDDEHTQQLKEYLKELSSIFSQSDTDIGFVSLVEHEIKLMNKKPFKQPHRRMPPSAYDEVKKHLRDLIKARIIRKIHSVFASPALLVRKKDYSLRIGVDYRMLNKRSKKDAFALPRLDEMLDNLVGAKFFSVLDMKSGYHQMSIIEKDRAKSAFTVGPLSLSECRLV